MERKLSLVLALLVLLFAGLACSFTIPRPASLGSMRGSGNVVEQTFDVSGFDRVTLAGIGNLHIQTGEREGLRVSAEDNLIPLLDVYVSGGELIVGLKSQARVSPTRPMDFYVTVTDLHTVRLLGSGDVEIGKMETDTLEVQIAGSGDVSIEELLAQRLDVAIPGSGRVEAAGEVRDQSITILGSGNYNARNLKSTSAAVHIAGSGTITVDVSDELDVNIAGNGTVRYIGNPQVKKSILGSGDISKID